MFAIVATLGLSIIAARAPSLMPGDAEQLSRFEQQLAVDPEDLRVGAAYRQIVIRMREYDRAIKFLDRLASRPAAGPNVYLTLALAYIDKVPDAGALRQLYLGRDAIGALTKSLERKRDEIPLYVRGQINLYYDTFIFHRTDKAVADLEEARRLAAVAHPNAPWVARIHVSLGDAYWRLGQHVHAREVWRDALTRFPAYEPLAARVRASDREIVGILAGALDPNTRVDTSLRELFPDSAPDADVRR